MASLVFASPTPHGRHILTRLWNYALDEPDCSTNPEHDARTIVYINSREVKQPIMVYDDRIIIGY